MFWYDTHGSQPCVKLRKRKYIKNLTSISENAMKTAQVRNFLRLKKCGERVMEEDVL